MEMKGFRVRPEHFIGLELNKQAVAIAQLVLWIGYFQWQHKTTGKADTGDRPLLPKDRSIFEQDAVLAYDERVPRCDPDTHEILTVWDGHSTKPHPITGKEVPDESARTVLFDYLNPRRAEWPKADFIAGNPPFIGASRMREALEQQLLTRLVALNHERAAEEKRGLIRYLRPDYQRGGDHRSPSPPEASIQGDLAGTEISSLETENLKLATQDWPTDLPAQVAAVRKLLPTIGQDPESGSAELAERLAACFGRKNKKCTDQITGILATLKALGHI